MSNDTQLVDMLDTGVVGFSFRKKDGTVRKMLATRSLNLIPKDAHPVTTPRPVQELKAIPVFDVEQNEWRSYSVGSVLTVDSYRNF